MNTEETIKIKPEDIKRLIKCSGEPIMRIKCHKCNQHIMFSIMVSVDPGFFYWKAKPDCGCDYTVPLDLTIEYKAKYIPKKLKKMLCPRCGMDRFHYMRSSEDFKYQAFMCPFCRATINFSFLDGDLSDSANNNDKQHRNIESLQ